MDNIRFDFSDFHRYGSAFYQFLGLRKRGPDGKILNPWNIAYGASSLGLKAASLVIGAVSFAAILMIWLGR